MQKLNSSLPARFTWPWRLTRVPCSPSRFRTVVTFCLVVASLASVGCGPTTDRLRVRGEVRLDGQPVNAGSISFKAADSTQTASAGAMIRDGKYDIPQDKGLRPGVYWVSISSPDLEGPKVPYVAGPGQPPTMVARERIPASYNIESKHTIELAVDAGNVFDFDITSGE